MKLVLLMAAALVFAAPNVTAQDSQLKDPTCEEDPNQAGCDPGCASPDMHCDHPPCPTGLAAQALPQGRTPEVFMTWTLNSFSDIRIERAEGDGDFREIDYLEFPDTRGGDPDTEPGVTYQYRVIAVGMHQYNESIEPVGESQGCEVIEVTSVPVFSSALAGLGAVAVAALAYAGIRRR